MKFQTITIIKYKIDAVWKTMRDDLPELAYLMEDIESITEKERHVSPSVHKVINIWKSATKLPPIIMRYLNTDMFTWTDRAEWNNESLVCNWKIEPHHFRDSIHCKGKTSFESAMGGLGTKITFSGDLEYNSQKLIGITNFIGDTVLGAADSIIRIIVQKNFRKIAEAIEKHLVEKK